MAKSSAKKGCQLGCIGCGGMLFVLFLIVIIAGLSSKQRENLVDVLPAYSIISDDEFGIRKEKREVAVRLEEPATEAELTAIAHKIKGEKRKSYEWTNILYLLPDMELGDGAWARALFNPDLEVRIFDDQMKQINTEGDTTDSR